MRFTWNWASHLEAEDDGPDKAQREAVVSVYDVVGAHVLQVNPLLLQELQSLVHILQTVDAHAALGGFGLKPNKTGFIYGRCSHINTVEEQGLDTAERFSCWISLE